MGVFIIWLPATLVNRRLTMPRPPPGSRRSRTRAMLVLKASCRCKGTPYRCVVSNLSEGKRREIQYYRVNSMRSTSLFFFGLTVALQAACTFAASAPKISNTVYLIRHGEKPSDGGQGLSAQGEERAECLTNVRFSLVFPPFSGLVLHSTTFHPHTYSFRPFCLNFLIFPWCCN